MDWQVIDRKLESLGRSIRRIRERCPRNIDELVSDFDTQDILTLNLSRAIQICVDIGMHLLADTEYPSPETMGSTFDILCQMGVIRSDLATRMKKSVGFRNLAVHNYEAINWSIVLAISTEHLQDFEQFAKAVTAFRDRKA
ncbi:MAG: DUF86 domain-containing protein [Chlorobiaceae bacterium]|nr:DUF86 domain-containing protein [Chlorobiaceae bacterium]